MVQPFSPTHCQSFHITELTVATVMARQAERRGDATFLHDLQSDRKYSYSDADMLTNRIANGLLALGIGKGDHVGMMLESGPECVFTYLAIGKIGAVSVPINTASRGEGLAYLLDNADAVAVIAETACTAVIAQVAADMPRLRLLVTLDALDKVPGLAEHVAVTPHARLLESAPHPPAIDVAFDDPAFIMYTSGTTGPSKGNVLVQATGFLWEQAAGRYCDADENDTYYSCVAMGHVAGLFGIVYLMLSIGGTIALASRFSATNFWSDIRRTNATLAMLLGAMLNFVHNQPPSEDDRDHRLRVLLGGPLPKDARGFEERFGILLCQGYGLSDHSSFIKFVPGENPDKLGSIGKPVEPFEVRIVDQHDFDMPVGQTGEIVVRSTQPWRNSSGYYKNPQASMAARRNDWFHTGDRGFVDADGFYWFVDRAKDSIRRRGENISAFEVERVLLAHPAVSEAAVFPVPAETSEDEVAAILILHDGATLDFEEFIGFCVPRLAAFMVPRFIHIGDALPKTITQRVEKYKLRQWAETNLGRFWDRGDGRIRG